MGIDGVYRGLTISPDLLFKSKESGNLFIVEVKKPFLDIDNPSFKEQLSSYMGIMRVDLGILIGNRIQLFVEGKLLNKSGIILFDEINFERDSEKGFKFVQLFSRENYNNENIEAYVREKNQELLEIENFENLKKLLLSNKFNEKIIDYLKSELLKDNDEKIIEKIFQELKVNIQCVDKNTQIDNNDNRQIRRYKSNSNFKLSTEELPIGKYVRKTFTELVKNNLIDQNEVERLQQKDYSKLTFDIQFPFLANEDSEYYIRERYWKEQYHINGKVFFVCSQWYEVSANNDRPYYEEWLKKMKRINNTL